MPPLAIITKEKAKKNMRRRYMKNFSIIGSCSSSVAGSCSLCLICRTTSVGDKSRICTRFFSKKSTMGG